MTTKAAKPAKDTATLTAFEFPKMDMANFDMPQTIRAMTEKGVDQMKDAYNTYKGYAEDATETMEETFNMSSKHAADLNSMMLSNAKSNVNAAFDHAEKLIGVKTFAEALELQSEFARKQFEVMTDQMKTIQEKATKIAEESSKPVKDSVSKVMDSMKAA